MKKVLITGLGYIGGRLALHLTKVPGLSVAVTTLGESIPDSVRDVLGDISVIPMDLLKDDIEKLAKKIEGFDAIVHLATINENQSVENPAKAIAVNTVGTFNILQASVLSGIEKFIYFSTAHVYAAPLVGNISEKNLTRPTHPYAYTHRAAEDYVLATRDTSKLDAIVIRLSNSFGPPAFPEVDRWTLLSNDLCRQAVQNGKMVLRSSGLQERDFITLEDVLEEIFGEVQDEFDADEEADIKEIGENTYLANAMMRLDEVAEFFEVELIDEDVDTIGGLVVKDLGRIAQIGDCVKVNTLEFCVKEIDGARITKLVIIKKATQEVNDANGEQ